MPDLPGLQLYRHSGIVPPGGWLRAAILGSVIGSAVGAAYGFLGLWAHLFFEGKYLLPVQGVGCFIVAGVVGYATGVWLTRGHVRNARAAKLAAVIAGLVTLYVAWVFWFFALSGIKGLHESLPALFAPTTLWHHMTDGARNGVWEFGRDINVKPDPIKGVALWVIWVLEALMVLGLAAFLAADAVNKNVYCESCRRWGTKRTLAKLQPDDPAAMQQALERGDLSRLSALPPATTGGHTEVILEGCPDCANLQALTVNILHETTDPKTNKTYTSTKTVIERLTLSPEQILTLATIAATAAPGP